MSSSKVNFSLSPNLRLARRGSATPLECTEKKSPLLRRGSWSPNLRLLRRSSDSNAVKDGQTLVRIRFFPELVLFHFVLLPMRASSRWKLNCFGFVCLRCCSRSFFLFFFVLKAKLTSCSRAFTYSSTISSGICFVSSETLFLFSV